MLNMLNRYFIHSNRGIGKILCYEPKKTDIELQSVIKLNKKKIEDELLIYGGILFRGFKIPTISEFDLIASQITPNLHDYHFRSTPRTKVEGKVYTSTEYPSDRFIPFHNECSYSNSWPAKIMFLCVIAPEQGGETALADSRHTYNKISTDIRNTFNEKELVYVRNYILGLDMSWQDVFQTNNKEKVEKYCDAANISYEWKVGKIELTTKQKSQVSITHPETQEAVWFNQAHLFHTSSLQEREKTGLLVLLGRLENLPRNVLYGDGSIIQDQAFDNIRATYESERIEFRWQEGDLLILDNVIMAHSRNAFKGNRKILVAMGG